MGRLIDADEFTKKAEEEYRTPCPTSTRCHYPERFGCCYDRAICKVVEIIKSLPTVDAVPVKRGKWILHDNGDATCNQCGRWQKAIWDYDNFQNYCGNCGAEMIGVENERD